MHILRVLHPISRSFSSTFQASSAPFRRQGSSCRLSHFQTRGKFRQLQANPLWRPLQEHIHSGCSSTRSTPVRSLQGGPGANNGRPSKLSTHVEVAGLRDLQIGVRYAGPAAWVVVVSAGIFISLAFLEAREQLKPAPSRLGVPAVLDPYRPQRSSKTPTEVAQQWWSNQDAISKTTIGIMGVNTAVHLTSFVLPKLWFSFWQIPISTVNYPLFTSMFVHSGAFHLGFNMWACFNFVPPVGHSRLFEGNPYHTLSFFLSAGVLSGLGQHFSTALARSAVHYTIPSGGASGALFGVFAAFCMQYPQAEVGIILLPFRFDAQSLLPCVMVFDFLGMIGLFNLGLGHGAHLAGAFLGVGYSYFDGKNKIWVPLVDFWKRRLKDRPS